MLFAKKEQIANYTVLFPRKQGAYAETYRVKDENGNTALFDAIFNSKGKSDITLLLKENGADYQTPNNYGVSPKKLAETIENFDVSYLFK